MSTRCRWTRSPSTSSRCWSKELDPHSVYIPAAEMQALNEPLEGEFDGIGVVFNMATDTVIVLNVIPQGPSDKASIKAGDRIVEIGDSLVAGRKIAQNNIHGILARTARHRRSAWSRTGRASRPGRGRGRARRHSSQEHRIGLPHRADGVGYVGLGRLRGPLSTDSEALWRVKLTPKG